METAHLKRMRDFFTPRHIAVVGASTRNFWFENIVSNASRAGFEGHFYPVNPKADLVHGVKAYGSIADLPENTIDFGVIVLKTDLVMAALRQLAAKGVRHGLLIASGYAETGPAGLALQAELVRYCQTHDILLLGPNCLGFINGGAEASVFAGGSVEGTIRPGSIGVIGQSGASTEMLVSKILARGLGISLYATTGNEALLTTEEVLDYLVHDGQTRIVTAFIEGFRDVPRLRRIARQAARRGIPLIMLKVGRSEKGRLAAQSHTGALAGDDAVTDAFMRQLGIVRVESIEELVETARAFSRLGLPSGDGLGICTLSGGLCGHGIELPELSVRTVHDLAGMLPAFAQAANPLDVTGAGFQDGFERIVATLARDPGLAVVAALCFAPQSPDDVFCHAVREVFLPLARSLDKPLVPLIFREMNTFAREFFDTRGLYCIEQPELGFRALAHLFAYARYLRQTQGDPAAD